MSKRVVFDFDGVIHSYASGWRGDMIIPDPPVPGIRETLKRLRDAGYEVVIVSCRCSSPTACQAMWEWCQKYDIVVDAITNKKVPARCYVDDRAICFDANADDADDLFEKIDNFEPWWKEPDYRGEYERR